MGRFGGWTLAACALAAGCGGSSASAPPAAGPGETGAPSAAEPAIPRAEATAEPLAPEACPPEAAAEEPWEIIRLRRPPFAHYVAEGDDALFPPEDEAEPAPEHPAAPEAAPPPRLRQRARERNQVTDTEAWRTEHGFTPPYRAFSDAAPGELEERGVPPAIEGARGSRIIDHEDHRIYLYDDEGQRGRFLLLVMNDGQRFGPYDFASYRDAETASEFTAMGTEWAMRVGDRLLVTHAHATYAEASGGHNAYLSALSLEGPLEWRSDALVANAAQCAVRGGYAICGYGFTSEPDFLYVLDLRDGRTVGRTPVRSGPELIVLRGDQLFVRTYDTNYVFDVR